MATDISRFNCWMQLNFQRIRAELQSNAIIDEDAFQDAYIGMVKAMRRHTTDDYFTMFMAYYRASRKGALKIQMRYSHPNPLFFDFLKESEQPEDEKPKKKVVSVEAVEHFCRENLDKDEYMLFTLKFKNNLPNTTLAEFYGISSKSVSAKVQNIKHKIAALI